MTDESVIRLLLMAVLVRQVIGCWLLFGQEWRIGERIKQWRQPKRRKRYKWYKKAKPFEGLTRKPVCSMCKAAEHGDERIEQREPPAKIEQKRGAKRRVDTSKQFCPERVCRYYGWLDRGNIVSNGHPSGGKRRQLRCEVCGKYFQETMGTVFHGSSVSAGDIVHAIALLYEGVSPRKVGRVYKVDEDTVLGWLLEAAGHSGVVLGYMMHHMHLEQVQMDELYALLSGPRGGEERGKCWVWAAIPSAVSKLLLAIEVGDRSLEVAQRLVHGVMSVPAPGVVPLFVTAQLAAYARALLGHFGQWVERVNEQSGRVVRRWVPEERLLYAQMKERRVRRKLVGVSTHVVYATKAGVRSVLQALGQRINTSYIERVNRTLRAHVPGLGRREEGLAKGEKSLRRRSILVMGYYNLCLPHTSLRAALVQPISTEAAVQR